MCLARAEVAKSELASRAADHRGRQDIGSNGQAAARMSSERFAFPRATSPLPGATTYAQDGQLQLAPLHPPAPTDSSLYAPEVLASQWDSMPGPGFQPWEPVNMALTHPPDQAFDDFQNLQFPDSWQEFEDLIDRLTAARPDSSGPGVQVNGNEVYAMPM